MVSLNPRIKFLKYNSSKQTKGIKMVRFGDMIHSFYLIIFGMS